VRLLDRYTFKEFITVFLGTVFMLTMLLMVSVVMDNIKDFIASKESSDHIVLFLLYNIPKMVITIIPPALMFSVCFVVGQLNANKELVSMMAAGISFYRAVAPLFIFGIFIWLFVLFANEIIVRKTNSLVSYQQAMIKKGVGVKTDLVYQLHIKGQEGFYYVYWYDAPTKTVRGGFSYIKINSQNLPEYVISAQTAVYNPAEKNWKLLKIEEIIFDSNLQVTSFTKIPEKVYVFPEASDYFAKPIKKVEEMNIFELLEEVEVRKTKGMPYSDVRAEIHSIFAVPLMCLIVVVIGAIAGSFTKRSAGVASLGVTILVVLLYYILYSTGRSLAEQGGIPVALGIWTTPTLFFFASYFLYRKYNL
jgi:lipopolysaccharide export system permease protein